MVGVRDQVGLLCGQLSNWPSLDGIIRDAGAGTELDALLAVLGSDDAPDPVRVAGWVETIEDACARKGLAGITSREYIFRPLPAGLSGTPGAQAWVCPRGRCDRVVLPEETVPTPVCAVAGGAAMSPFTVPPP